jgi:hypothetical protein
MFYLIKLHFKQEESSRKCQKQMVNKAELNS